MAPDLDEYRRTSLDSWDRFSVNWEREHDYLWSKTGLLGERLVERLDPQPGDTVLELAAGNGDTGFLAAERIGSDGRLISTDFAPGMVEVARRAAEARRLGESSSACSTPSGWISMTGASTACSAASATC